MGEYTLEQNIKTLETKPTSLFKEALDFSPMDIHVHVLSGECSIHIHVHVCVYL